ncbi:phage minor head protein [Clostridium minihomine]|uniref:phage minor head protein n=1 Tax=Clostridium minihomine TaxID=2045012 RepID=UPI000C762D74|nr:ribonuclease domain-containing protein [Clostridium minihomine]
MYIKQAFGYVLQYEDSTVTCKELLDFYDPPVVRSINWKHWVTRLDFKTCLRCRDKNGQIYGISDTPWEPPPLHPNCRCSIEMMSAVVAGNGTKDGKNGADWWMKNHGILPDYYISEKDLINLKWKWGKAPAKFAPGKMAAMGIYKNEDGHLPQVPGRIWHEADINYYKGKRNKHRLLWSNDGLLFVTYDHYETFIEVL